MTLQFLTDSDFLYNVLPQAWQKLYFTDLDPANGQWYSTGPDGGGGIFGALSDYVDEQPTFDTEHQRYVPETSVGSTGIVNNLNGLNSSPNTLSLNYAYQTGHTSTHTTTSAITAGTTARVSAEFPLVGGTDLTFSFSGTFSYADATTDSTLQTVTETVGVPITVPAGKVYEASIVYTQETLIVPFSMTVHVTGVSDAWFGQPLYAGGESHFQTGPADLFWQINNHGSLAGPDSSMYNPNSDWTEGLVTLTGEVTMARSGGFETRITDITDRYTSANSALAAPQTLASDGGGDDTVLAGDDDGSDGTVLTSDDGGGDDTVLTGDDGGGDDTVLTDDDGGIGDDTAFAGDDYDEASAPTPATLEAPLL